MTNLESISKSRDIPLLTKVFWVKVTIFPVVMYGCEGWTIKKDEHQRIDTFKLWCWRRLLRIPWTARRSSQLILKEINPEYSLEWLKLKPQSWNFSSNWSWSWSSNTLVTWYEELNHWKRPWWWGRLKAVGKRDGRGWDGWMASVTQWTWVWANSGRWWRTRKSGMLQSMGSQRFEHDWATEQQ